MGGGLTLLKAIINTLPGDIEVVFCLDKRVQQILNMPQNVHIKYVEPTIRQRLAAERWLSKNVAFHDVVLCFGNLPPLFKLRGHVSVFVQNRYLIDGVKLDGFSLKTKLRLRIERLLLTYRTSNVDEFIVQTPSMKLLLKSRIKTEAQVSILPFVANDKGYLRRVEYEIKDKQKDVQFDFLYVASGEPHKNHRQLIEAWCLLANEGLYPSLKLTLDETISTQLCDWIEKKVKQYQLNVENLGYLSNDQIQLLYRQSSALVYPSTLESFGLPLIEARQAGLPVLASELDYVRDILDPEQVFDPQSALSIARAVKRFIGTEDSPLPLIDAANFIKNILIRAQ